MSKWKPGQSGNPTGKKRDSTAPRQNITRFREHIQSKLPEIIDKIVTAALAGDMVAARLLLERGIPAYRSEAPAVKIPAVSAAHTLTDKGRAVVDAAATGEIDPTTAGELLGAVVGVARLAEVDEQQAKLKALEDALVAKGINPDEFV